MKYKVTIIEPGHFSTWTQHCGSKKDLLHFVGYILHGRPSITLAIETVKEVKGGAR
jgi:hypothetical protein